MTNPTQPRYDVDYFVQKFSAIPDKEWYVGGFVYENRYCALGHCGQLRDVLSINQAKPEARALIEIFTGNDRRSVAQINDGEDIRYQQPTPKARILAALMDCKARAEAELDRYERRELLPTSKPAQPVSA